jgi:hypothetical protein
MRGSRRFLQNLCSLTKAGKQLYIVPVLTQTNPAGQIIGPDHLSTCKYVPLTLRQRVSFWLLLVNAGTQESTFLRYSDVKNSSACVALAEGHPSLLLDCFNLLTRKDTPGYQLASVGASAVALATNHWVPKSLPEKVTAEKAKCFVQDVLTSRLLDEGSHSDILDVGLAWFLTRPYD